MASHSGETAKRSRGGLAPSGFQSAPNALRVIPPPSPIPHSSCCEQSDEGCRQARDKLATAEGLAAGPDGKPRSVGNGRHSDGPSGENLELGGTEAQ